MESLYTATTAGVTGTHSGQAVKTEKEPCPVHGTAHRTKFSSANGEPYLKCIVHAISDLYTYAKEISSGSL
jgi:hypothetical protein